MPQALVVDDNENFTLAVAEFMEQQGFTVATARTLKDARALVQAMGIDLVLVDLVLPDGNGVELIREIAPRSDTRIVVITGNPSVDAAIESLRARVFDFLVKPVDMERLKACIKVLATPQEPAPEMSVSAPGSDREDSTTFCGLVGVSLVMQELYRMIEKVAPTDATVFLQGESGTGKELAAQAIHRLSPRRDNRFVAVNCGAISPNLIGSELFGHEKGSFTGATRQHKGHFERAAGGTLFLDEITEMPPELQVQLLRVLETGTLLRVGGDREIPVDVRLIAATNREPESAIAEGKLRTDLYFRLTVFPIYIPPLRERNGDSVLLANHFLAELNRQHGTHKCLTSAAIRSLEVRTWPGNVRELLNALQRAFILADVEIGLEHFTYFTDSDSEAKPDPLSLSVGTPIDDVERRLILATLKHFQGDKPRAAEALGISLKTLYNRLKHYETE